MKKNIGKSGRQLRFALAIILLLVAYLTMNWIVLIVALFVLFESMISWCIVNQILGKNSCPTKKRK